MTFSIAARCAQTGMFGVAISSSSPAVAARCAHARAGTGAVCSQNITDPRLGPRALDLMAAGATAAEATAIIARTAPHAAFRQVLIVDAAGGTGAHSGPRALGIWTEEQGPDAVAGGNLLAHAGVPRAMLDSFAATPGHLGARLMAALEAGLAAGGEAGPVHSAGLKVVHAVDWPVVDLRIDWHETPIAALRTAWDIYAPQIEDYVTRALNPEAAPGYGVPGDWPKI